MPNTLAHIGVQALITRGLIARADLGWIGLGCILPDLPWIIQRVVTILPIGLSPIDLRLYAVVQSSLLFCLVASAAFACLAPRAVRVFGILALGCLLHLLLDATQTKWANGVLLFAPFDWYLLNFGFYWPENWPSHLLGLVGLAYGVWAVWRIGPSSLHLWPVPVGRVLAALTFLGLYLAGPLMFMPAADAADLHFAATLRDGAGRPGQLIEFDRSDVWRAADGATQLGVWTGETLALIGQPLPEAAQGASIRGRFVDAQTIEVTAFHLHPTARRELLSILGLGLVLAWWGAMVVTGLRRAAD